MSWVTQLARPEVLRLAPYEHAIFGGASTRLHANESPWRLSGDGSAAGLNRYPEPQSLPLRERLAQLYDVSPEQLLISRGSDEAIDLLVRSFCRPAEDAVLICPPTFGMYAVAAHIQGAALVSVPLRADAGFALDVPAVVDAAATARLVFLCSPNNPTGNLLDADEILRLTDRLAGRALVVVDEAYIEFAGRASLAAQIPRRPNLAVLRTLSKAHGLAGARLGTLIADPEVIALVRKLIAPYAVPQLVIEAVSRLLRGDRPVQRAGRIATLCAERERLAHALANSPLVERVHPSWANFLLLECRDADAVLARAHAAGLLLRDVRGHAALRQGVRVSIGSPQENDVLLGALR